jgi:hypothetical protein
MVETLNLRAKKSRRKPVEFRGPVRRRKKEAAGGA